MKDFSFQGKVYLGTRLAGGLPGPLRWVGDAPVCTVTLATESETRKESYSGQRVSSAVLNKGNDAQVALTLNWANGDNLALGLYGSKVTVAAGSVTSEFMPAGLGVGDTVALARGDISALVVTDSTGVPLTLVAGTNYAIDNAKAGTINILSLGAFVQPFKASYSAGASVNVAMFTVAAPERYLLLDGINTIDGTPVKVRLYRTKFNPASSLPLINESFGTLELTGQALFDSEAAIDPALGGFGKIEMPGGS
jgi:hypothetical protein